MQVGLLAWDTQRDVDPVTGMSTGPYEAWQVLTVGVLLLGLGLAAAWRGPGWLVLVVPVAFTVAWSVTAATAPDGDGLWPVGALLVAAGTAVGGGLCWVLASALRR
ncbi:hypothetical protein [Klenkia brasiliensis]|uniref:hypothetical protein n=1 Tax=Klenkia brasiliensis TaxID=333142 RepID=UPI001A96D470|nr:hypothetical protein [Klenkia brasiliensis]